MSLITVTLIAFALAADAFAAAIGKGIELGRPSLSHAVAVGGLFGGFQALMPFLGCQIGEGFLPYVTAVDH